MMNILQRIFQGPVHDVIETKPSADDVADFIRTLPDGQAPVLVAVGVAGSGKTTILQKVASALGKNGKFFLAVAQNYPSDVWVQAEMEMKHVSTYRYDYKSRLGCGAINSPEYQSKVVSIANEALQKSIECKADFLILDELEMLGDTMANFIAFARKQAPKLGLIIGTQLGFNLSSLHNSADALLMFRCFESPLDLPAWVGGRIHCRDEIMKQDAGEFRFFVRS